MKIKFTKDLVAPCGINCGVCSRYLAYSRGLREAQGNIPYCAGCRPRKKKCTRCPEHGRINKIGYCFKCSNFPCVMIKRLEKRYLNAYKRIESPVKNLRKIKREGMSKFLLSERKKWKCPECGGTICVHNGLCFDHEKVTSWR